MTNNIKNLLKRKEIFATIDTGDKDHHIEIYNPNQEQRKIILDLILSNIKVDKEKMTTNISGSQIIFTLINEITNIDLGLDVKNPEHIKMAEEICDDPSDIFLDVVTQINKIVNKQFYRYYDNLKQLLEMPLDLRNAYIENLDKIRVEEEKKVELTEEEKRIAELEKQLNELKSKKEGK